MRLDTKQIRELRKILLKLITKSTLKLIVSDAGYNIEEIVSDENLEVVMQEVLHRANDGGWIDQIIEEASTRYKGYPDLKNFVESLTLPPPPATSAFDPYGVCYVENRPFVDRRELRTVLKSIIDDGGPRILMVQGDQKTGKSYTLNLIRHLAKHKKFEVVPIDLASFTDAPSPYAIGTSLARKMGLPEPLAPGSEQWARWTGTYFEKLIGQIRAHAHASTATWWIVIDSFASISVPEAIHDFVQRLAYTVEELKNVHAVLISYEHDLPVQVEPIVVKDRTREITVEDLSAFFVQFYHERKPMLTAAIRQDRATLNVQNVMQRAGNATTAARQEVIGREVFEECKQILTAP